MWTESNTPSKIEGAGGADVPKALIYPDFLNQVITIGYQLMNKGRLLLRVRLIYN